MFTKEEFRIVYIESSLLLYYTFLQLKTSLKDVNIIHKIKKIMRFLFEN